MNYIWGAVALVLFGLGFHFGGLSAEARLSAYKSKANAAIAQAARQEAAASEHAREVEKAAQERVERLAQAYEVDKQNAQESANRTIADLRSGAIRLRAQWQGCIATDKLSSGAEASRLADEYRQLREKDTKDLIGIGREADDKERAHQRYAESVSE